MDLIRIFTEIAFAKVARRYIIATESAVSSVPDDSYILPVDIFIDEARIHHPELSDDSLRMIYNVGVDEWSRFGYDSNRLEERNIFQALACLSTQLAEDSHGYPMAHFKHLFRWREVTQTLGEDLLSCSLLAFVDRDSLNAQRKFDWPSVVHNDNPHLNYLFKTKGLCELHSHLKATTNTFEISWVSLMNHIGGLNKQFDKLAQEHEPSLKASIGSFTYSHVAEAVALRLNIYDYLNGDSGSLPSKGNRFNLNSPDVYDSLDSETHLKRDIRCNDWIPDYICIYPGQPMSIYAGERWLLYNALKQIYATNDKELTRALYKYILIKSLLRGYFIQINKNVGFSNFQKFQNIKSTFIKDEYKEFLESLPLWEAREHNFTKVFETRIVPVKSKKDLLKAYKGIYSLYSKDDWMDGYVTDEFNFDDWTLIFHFIKTRDKTKNKPFRDYDRRNSNKSESRILSGIPSVMKNPGIDAASSEFANRPEAFSQSFRYLRHFGFDATFHAGEDFYDLADGLRAIDEAIHLLDLKARDRIGHALALGMDACEYYKIRHNYIVLPKQWMLDNVVWLWAKSQKSGIQLDPATEFFLKETYRNLCKDIGYRSLSDSSQIPDMYDYRDSLLLRGDNPDVYASDGTVISNAHIDPESWDYYALLDSEAANNVRNHNATARTLLKQYHADGYGIREKGNETKAFHLPDGYHLMITALQDAMIRAISKQQICIECCPSSNVRIGRLERFDVHPIFRFMPVRSEETRYPLAVTINTDDLGVFSTSLPNEYSLLALALLKKKEADGKHLYSSQEVYDWISRVIDNGYKFTFIQSSSVSSHEFS